uniref:BMA-DNC-2, isoform d n=1 Tax=Brugia malayi TaxID=6279 RepID=A0A1I9G163_BRUMA|nr:BMA-DNC-2, isoform d [Brugia malayi]
MSLRKEDVYETEDLPEDDQQMIEDEMNESEEIERVHIDVDNAMKRFKGRLLSTENVEIERVHIDVDNAMKRFKGRLLSTENVDFSDSIVRRKRCGYGGGSYVLEVIGPYADETETLEQKFTRLNCEINDLAESLREQKVSEKPDSCVVHEEDLIAMLETLKALQMNKDDITTCVQSEKKDDKTESATRSAENSIMSGRLAVLENRINRLEQMIDGVGYDESMKICKIPIAEAIEDLRMRVQLLHPAHVDGLHSRITQLLSKLQQVEEKKKEKCDSEFEDKVDKLYEMMSRWDVACTGLSSAVKRMYDLRKLHEQAEHFSKKLSQLTGIRSQLAKTMEREEMMLFDFRQQTHAALEKLGADIARLEERINKLNS